MPISRGTAFFSPFASWNRKAKARGIDSSNEAAEALKRLMGQSGDARGIDHLKLYLSAYTVPSYNYAEQKTTCRPIPNTDAMAQGFGNLSLDPSTGKYLFIPWSDDWKPSPGNDRSMNIIDYDHGVVWDLWEAYSTGFQALTWPGILNGLGNPWIKTNSCGSVYTYQDLWTGTDDGRVWNRGCGLKKQAMLLRAAEVATGQINHSIAVTWPKPMFGPFDAPGYMTYRKPATRNEFAMAFDPKLGGDAAILKKMTDQLGWQSSDANRLQSLPSGLSFVWDYTTTEIGTILDTLGIKTNPLRQSLTVIVQALCYEYGCGGTLAETYGYNKGIETDGIQNPVSAAEWKALGFVPDGTSYPMADVLQAFNRPERTHILLAAA